MTILHRMISAGFAVAALASASVPALAWTVWPDVDFEWYANVGRPAAATMERFPVERPGYIWSPAHYERVGSRQVWVEGQWVKDDFADQVAAYYAQPDVGTASGPMTLHDSRGDAMASDPEAYRVDSSISSRR